MTFKTMLLGAAMTGAMMVPALAMAEDAAMTTDAKAPMTQDAKMEKGQKMFDSFDADKNGSISEDEFMNHKKAGRDSKMSAEQMAEKKKARFTEIDTDKDGKISMDEFKGYGARKHAMREEHKGMKADKDMKADGANATETNAPVATPAK